MRGAALFETDGANAQCAPVERAAGGRPKAPAARVRQDSGPQWCAEVEPMARARVADGVGVVLHRAGPRQFEVMLHLVGEDGGGFLAVLSLAEAARLAERVAKIAAVGAEPGCVP